MKHLITVLLPLFCSTALLAQTITVTNLNNTGTGSLRQAVAGAAAGSTIVFQTGLSGTITLDSQIDLNKNLTIDGTGATITISGNDATRIFSITSGAILLSRLTLTNGRAIASNGGAILLDAGALTMNNCTISNSTADGDGGAIRTALVADLTVNNSTFSGNSGAIFHDGNVSMTNVTMSGNTGNQVIYAQNGTLNLMNCTIAGNSVGTANLWAWTTVNMTNTILQSLRVNGGTTTPSHCLIQTTPLVLAGTLAPGTNNLIGIDPLLGALQDNGGPTQTMALRSGSPCWRAGTTAGAPTLDQRGNNRPNDEGTPIRASIGAFDEEFSVALGVVNNADAGVGSLRRAISNAVENDSIIFNPALSGQTITLTTGQLEIDKSLTIHGLGADNLSVSGNDASRVLFVNGTGASFISVTISSLTIRNGRLTAAAASGMGIFSDGTVSLTLRDCEIRECVNSAVSNGGAIATTEISSLNIENCTFANNSVGGLGGAISVGDGFVSISSSTFTANSAAEGGAINNAGTTTFTINNSTIAGNSASTRGGGLYQNGGTFTLNNTIVAGNTAPSGPDISGAVETDLQARAGDDMGLLGRRVQAKPRFTKHPARLFDAKAGGASRYNLIGNGADMTGLVNADADSNLVGTTSNPINAQLAALANNGGGTRTMLLNAGSPAINKGNPKPDENGLATDQRGGTFVRISDGRMDIGAVEVQATSGIIVRDVVTSNATLPESGTGTTIDISGNEGGFGYIERIRFNAAAPNRNSIEPTSATPQTGGAFIPNTVSPERYWTISNSGVFFVEATLNITLAGIGGITNPDRLLIVRRASALDKWVAYNTAHASGVLSATFSNGEFYGDFAMASLAAENPLPVELASFSATRAERGVELRWTTASEKNNAGFEVQRNTENAIQNTSQWTVLGFVKGNGTTSDAQSYSFIDRTASGNVSYRLKQIDFDGQFEILPIVEVDAGLPRNFELGQNYPNPFNPTTVISYQLPVPSEVSLKVYDLLGREVATLVNQRQEAGRYQALFNAARLSSGVYFYRLSVGSSSSQAGIFVETKKMILMK